MNERIVRPIAALVLTGLIVLIGVVGWRRPADPPVTAASAELLPAAAASAQPASGRRPPAAGLASAQDSARGRAVFQKQGCGGCHTAAGAGGGQLSLNGVGSRRSGAELRAWTIGDASLAGSLAPATLRSKQAYARLPAGELGALLTFLASLKR